MRLPVIFITFILVIYGVVFGQTDSTRGKKAKEPAQEGKAVYKKIEKTGQSEPVKRVEPSGVEVTRAVICAGIDNLEPKQSAEKFTKDVGTIYCFSHVKGADKLINIVHKWYYKYKLISNIELRVKGDSWRTYSYKTITPEMVGSWKVEIVNSENDEVLQLLKFLVE